MRQVLSSILAASAVAALLVLAPAPTAALAAGGSSGAARPSAQVKRSSLSHPTRLSRGRNAGVVPVAPGEGYYSPGGWASVRAAQRLLARAGDSPGPIDGRYGPLTEQAVRRFQATHGLRVDGIVGPQTLAVLSAPTQVLFPTSGYYSPGGRASVRAAQRLLARAGDSPGPIDGRYGPLTEQAVRRFQATHGLRVDGIVGPQTFIHPGPQANTHPPKQATTQPRPAPHARVESRPPARTQAPRNVKFAHPSGSSSIGWWVFYAALGLGLALIAALERRAARRDQSIRSPTTGSSTREAGLEQPPNLGVLSGAERDQDGEVAFRRADRRGDAKGAFNLGLLRESQDDLAGAEAADRRADQRGDADEAGTARAALLDLHGRRQTQSESNAQPARRKHAERDVLAAKAQRDQNGAAADRLAVLAALGAFNLAMRLERRGKLASAEVIYRRADQRGLPAAAARIGALLQRQGDLAGAEAAYRRADQRGDAGGAFNLAQLLQARNELADAEAAYRRADQRDDPEVARLARLALHDLHEQPLQRHSNGHNGGDH